jgi:hypothetical protein
VVPSVTTNTLSYGALFGLYANLRYQMLCGLDRSMVHHFDVLGVAMFFSTAIRQMPTNHFYLHSAMLHMQGTKVLFGSAVVT